MFSRLDDLFKGLLAPLKENKHLRPQLVFYFWTDIVGERIAKVASPERVVNGILYVKTASSSWAQELSLLKPHILKELNTRLEENLLTDIYFTSGLKSKQMLSGSSLNKPWEQMQLTKEELAWLEEEVTPITDPELQEIVRTIRIKEEKLRRYKLRKGLSPCKGCGRFINPDEACKSCSAIA